MILNEIPLTLAEKQLHELAISQSKDCGRAESHLLPTIDRIDRLKLYKKFRLRSTHAYCRKFLTEPDGNIYSYIAIARKSRLVPQLGEAVKSHALRLSTASKIVSVITPENHQEWIAKARDIPRKELERQVAAASPHKRKRTSVKNVDGETSRLSIDLPNHVLMMLERVRQLESQRTRKQVSLIEALEAAVGLFIEKRDPVEKTPRDSSKEEPAGPISRKRRNEILKRDRSRCQARTRDGAQCEECQWVEVHHIRPLVAGGTNEPDNLVTLCAEHHRQMHRVTERHAADYAGGPQ